MNITLFISRTYGGGAERVTCNLANYLANKGHHAEILVMAESKDSYYVDPAVKVIPLIKDSERKNSIYNALIRIKRLQRYMRDRKEIDRYVVMLPKTTIMMLALAGNTKARIIASERNNPAAYPTHIKMLLRHYIRRAAGVVFQTEDARAWYGAAVASCKTEVIPNAINPDFIREPFRGERLKRIVAAGRLTQQKNFAVLIKAFAKIADDIPEYDLTIFGEGNERKNLESQVKQLGLEHRISLPGHTTHLAEELERSSLYVLSSDFEGMPNTLMEAMALGLPCISTDCPCGGPRYLIRNGINGLLVPVMDEDMMSQAMLHLVGDNSFRNRLAQEAENIKARLNSGVIYAQWNEFICNTVSD